MKEIFTFLGLPASGKGTQAEDFAKRKGLTLIGIGDLIREEIENDPNSKIVHQIEARYDKGVPQKDEVIFWLIRNKLKSIEKGVVFDNFPFSEAQIKFIDELVKEGWEEPKIIYIKISEDTAYKRICSRRICPKCGDIYKNNESECPKCMVPLETRTDDTKDVLEKRLSYYKPRLQEMIEHYNKMGRVIEIDGEPSVEQVRDQIIAIT